MESYFESGNHLVASGKKKFNAGTLVVAIVCGLGCSGDPKGNTDTEVQADDGPVVDTAAPDEDGPESTVVYEIIPGVGIGPVELGGTYGALVEAYGEPDALVDYYRIFFATWLELGVEVVVGSANDDAPEPG